jgi:hypothetical protein
MQEAIVSNPAKALGQDMLEDKPQEVLSFDGAVERLAGAALDVSEGDLAVLMGDDVVFTDDTPVQVTRPIL